MRMTNEAIRTSVGWVRVKKIKGNQKIPQKKNSLNNIILTKTESNHELQAR